jgi:hypothetical protein
MTPFDQRKLLDQGIYYDGDSVARLLGVDTRTDNKWFIYRSFPFMEAYTIEGIQSFEYERGLKNYQVQTAIHFFASTPNPIVLTDEEKEAIELTIDPYTEIIEPKVLRILGKPYSDEGCQGLDRENNVDYDFLVDRLYEDTQIAAEDSLNHLLAILLCERDGKIEDTDCTAEDFEYTYSDSPVEPSKEELEILEGRRQDAEREAQKPSTPSYSSATPLQLCGSLGAVVQTESYGELTCKFVWLNRVKALVWMRS